MGWCCRSLYCVISARGPDWQEDAPAMLPAKHGHCGLPHLQVCDLQSSALLGQRHGPARPCSTPKTLQKQAKRQLSHSVARCSCKMPFSKDGSFVKGSSSLQSPLCAIDMLPVQNFCKSSLLNAVLFGLHSPRNAAHFNKPGSP